MTKVIANPHGLSLSELVHRRGVVVGGGGGS